MFSKFISAAVAFVASMLLSTFLKVTLEPTVLPKIANSIGKDSMLYRSIAGTITWLPVIVMVAIVLGILARGVTESRLPG